MRTLRKVTSQRRDFSQQVEVEGKRSLNFIIKLNFTISDSFDYSQVFYDRLKTQEDIQGLLTEIFGSKKRMNLDEFKRVTQEVSSEMFLSIIILLQSSLPCTENFQRYQKNFEKYMGGDDKKEGDGAEDGKTKTIASPRLMGNLSPIASLAKNHGINFQPPSQSTLLQYAANKKSGEEEKFDSEAVGAFKTAKQDKAERAARKEELAKLVSEGKDTIQEDNAVRLPNAVNRPKALTLSTNPDLPTQQMVMSPTAFLTGQPASPRLHSFATNEKPNSPQIEGEIIRKATDTKYKRYWYCLLGKELYVYKTKKEEKHKSMHSLVGVFIKDEVEEQLDSTTVMYPFKLIFPPNKARSYYLESKE